MLEQQKYHHIREQMRPGDIIAFGGNSLFSRWTKLTTRSAVTHIAIVMQTKMRDEASGRYFNQVMEATVYDGKKGVMTNRLSERVHTYDGDMWWLPLGESARDMFEQNKHEFFNFICKYIMYLIFNFYSHINFMFTKYYIISVHVQKINIFTLFIHFILFTILSFDEID